MEDRLVGVVPKNAREDLRVTLRTLRGRRGVDLRVFAQSGSGERTLTPKGVVIRPDLLGAVIAALQEAQAAAREEGVIPEPEAP